MARRQADEERKLPVDRVTAALKKTKYTFTEPAESWQQMLWENMMPEDKDAAGEAWRKANFVPGPASNEVQEEAEVLAEEEDRAIDKRMVDFMRQEMKWTNRELHDALLTAGTSIPAIPSMRNYFAGLLEQFGRADAGFLPQNMQSHTKEKLKAILRILSRTGVKLGNINEPKPVLAESLARSLNLVLNAGCAKPGSASEDDIPDDDMFEGRPQEKKVPLVEHTHGPGEIPDDAVVTAEQAESALGRTIATEFEIGINEAADADTQQEEEALAGYQVNPPGVDYSCIAWQPNAPDLVTAAMAGWESHRPIRELRKADFLVTAAGMSSCFQKGLEDMSKAFKTEFAQSLSAGGYEERVKGLDPTQKLVVDVVAEWAMNRGTWKNQNPARPSRRLKKGPGSDRPPPQLPPSLRMLLLGTAGTGKTHTAKVGITEARIILGSYDSVLTMAFSGVASANLGTGSRTIDSIFHTNQADAGDDLTGTDLDELVRQLEHIEFIVIDEISTCGAAALEVVSRRMRQVARVLWRRRFHCEPPPGSDSEPFGGIGVLLMGDFAQIPPVLATSLMADMPLVDSAGSRYLALAGRQTFDKFDDVIRLRRIHRQKGVCPYKESTMRLRDVAITVDDYDLWKGHQLESIDTAAKEPWLGAGHLTEDALFLVPENMPAGKVNGRRLAAQAPAHDEPSPTSSTRIVVRCESRHSSGRGAHRKAEEFRNVRQALHLCVGARVMLSLNKLWDVPTVPFGLMNGARGVVVAILYAAPGPASTRTNGCELAGTGFPSAPPKNFPRGLDYCPLPDMVVVHYPSYTGPRCFPDLPSTWVPVPSVEVRHNRIKSLSRVGIPLRLAWALTFHKCQGVTAEEGVIVSFDGCRGAHTVSKLGLAFVAWTRATSWAKMAFHKLPPLEDFVAARLTKEFAARSVFEHKADAMFAAFLAKRGITLEELMQAHEKHFADTAAAKENRAATAEELLDLRGMLSASGVAPVSESITSFAQQKAGDKSAGLWNFVASFRAEKAATEKVEKEKSKANRKASQQNTDGSTDAVLVEDITSDLLSSEAGAAAEETARQNIIDMGFSLEDMTLALESVQFNFQKAFIRLLLGLDDKRHMVDGAVTKRFARHRSQRTKHTKDLTDEKKYPQREHQYRTRSMESFGIRVHIWDLGMNADNTVNACFWLSLAAGLADCEGDVFGQALPADHAMRDLLGQLRRPEALADCMKNGVETVRTSPVGKLAKALRHHFCNGDSAVLLRNDVQRKIFQAFACIAGGTAATESDYTRWVLRLAQSEFADELVVVAVALEFSIRIVVIPYTPQQATRNWAIPTYGPPGVPLDGTRTMYLGNNDVHYVYLRSADL